MQDDVQWHKKTCLHQCIWELFNLIAIDVLIHTDMQSLPLPYYRFYIPLPYVEGVIYALVVSPPYKAIGLQILVFGLRFFYIMELFVFYNDLICINRCTQSSNSNTWTIIDIIILWLQWFFV